MSQNPVANLSHYEQLLNYRRIVSDMYSRVRWPEMAPARRCRQFRRERDFLFSDHPQSALSTAQKSNFSGLSYFPYNPDWRFLLPLNRDVSPDVLEISLNKDGITRMQRFGKIRFQIDQRQVSLSLFWILGYGGGVFLPFRDTTNGDTTYGGGRYMLDTIKHADLGQENDLLVIDFNFAYNPSCAYNARWHCPLSPEENRLPVAVTAGEQQYPDSM